jgi:Short C-terminal domain
MMIMFQEGPQPAQAEPDKKTGGWLYKGYNGDLVMTDRGVEIRRSAKSFFAGGGTVRGDKAIPYDSIVAIQFKKPGMATGFIQFSLRGGSEAKRGVREAVRDENTITFQRGSRWEEARDIIQWRIDDVKEQDRGRGSVAAPRDSVAKLGELATLHDQGVLTDEEFQAAKSRLLADM